MDSMSRRLEREIRPALQRCRVPGCSIAVVTRDGLVWAGGFGYADLRSGRPATADTVYRLFSGTKLFTAVAVLQLEERALLNLDDPVADHLPGLALDPRLSLLHLLSHRSGLRDTWAGFLAVSIPPEPVPSAGDALKGYRIESRRSPGERVEYRNVNYALLGEVVSRVSGLDYRDYIRRHLLTPLGMQAGFGLTDSIRPLAATGYIGRWDPMRVVLRALFPGLAPRLYGSRLGDLVELREYELSTSAIGGLVGSMSDFSSFLQAQLANGGPVLGPDAASRMQALVATGAAGVASRVGMGIGWKVGRGEGGAFLNHEGGGAGFTSELRLYPDSGIGIALGMNAMRMPKTMRLAHSICERVHSEREFAAAVA